MSGAIMPAPLAMPTRTMLRPPTRAVRVATFGKVSVVMMARAAVKESRRARLGREPPEMRGEGRRVERLADHAGRGEEDLVGAAADRGRGGRRARLDRLAALHAGEGVGVAGIDDERPRLPARQPCAAPLDRRGGAARGREDAGHGCRRIEADQQQVRAPLVADARLGGRQAHAGDRRQVRKGRPARTARPCPPCAATLQVRATGRGRSGLVRGWSSVAGWGRSVRCGRRLAFRGSGRLRGGGTAVGSTISTGYFSRSAAVACSNFCRST